MKSFSILITGALGHHDIGRTAAASHRLQLATAEVALHLIVGHTITARGATAADAHHHSRRRTIAAPTSTAAVASHYDGLGRTTLAAPTATAAAALHYACFGHTLAAPTVTADVTLHKSLGHTIDAEIPPARALFHPTRRGLHLSTFQFNLSHSGH